MTDLWLALEAVLADIDRGASVEVALESQGELRVGLEPLVTLALSVRGQPGLAPATKSDQARILVAHAGRVYPPSSPFPFGAAVLGVAGALILAAVLSGIAGTPPAAAPAPAATTTPPPAPAASLEPTARASESDDAYLPGGTGTPAAPSAETSPSPTVSASPSVLASPASTGTSSAVPARPGQRSEAGRPPGALTPSPTATLEGYPASTVTQVFAPTAAPVPPYP